MADILIHSTVPSLFTQTESASNLIIDNQTTDTQTNNNNNNNHNKYTGHVTRLRNVFTEQSLNSNEQPRKQHSNMNTQRKFSNSDQHYDFPADAVEQFKKLQREDNDVQIMPAFLPSNMVKRMNHLNTTFVKPTKIETNNLSKHSFEEQNKSDENLLIDGKYSMTRTSRFCFEFDFRT